MAEKKQLIEITQFRSTIACTENQKANLRGLGLNKRGHMRVIPDTSENRGMIKKVIHLLKVTKRDTRKEKLPKTSDYALISVKNTEKPLVEKASPKTEATAKSKTKTSKENLKESKS